MTRRTALVPLIVVLVVPACSGFSEAMTTHVDVAARAGSTELSVERLAGMLAHSKAPLQKELAHQLADFWVDYQLIARAAARGDSLTAPKDEDQALWAVIGSARARKFFDLLTKTQMGSDTAGYQAKYAAGDYLSARHILLMAPRGDTAKAGLDSVRRKAEALRAKVTKANFADLARDNSQDPGSARNGGDLKVFQKGQMVPEFEKALLATKPGEVAPGVIKTQFGYHIIYRPTYDEVKAEISRSAGAQVTQKAESLYIAKLDSSIQFRMTPGGTPLVRAVGKDREVHVNDRSPIATYSGGGVFTASRLAKWLTMFPPGAGAQLLAAPDSQIPLMVRGIVRNEVIIRQADSAKVTLDSAETNTLRHGYETVITNAWTQLGIDPRALADSAKAPAQREAIAAAHIQSYLDKLMKMSVRYVNIPAPVDAALRTKYEGKINDAGVDRAFALASKIRKSSDSSAAASRPPSAVPLPGEPPSAGGKPARPAVPPSGPPPGTKP